MQPAKLSSRTKNEDALSVRRSELTSTDAVNTPIWQENPVQGDRPTTSEVLERQRTNAVMVNEATEIAIVTALTAQLPEGMGQRDGATYREACVKELLGGLDRASAYALDRRIRLDSDADPIVAAFRRLIPERRSRLLQALARRRVMLAAIQMSQPK